MKTLIVAAGVLLLSFAPLSAQERVDDPTYGFSFPLPDSTWQKTKGLSADDLYTYVRQTDDGPCFLDFRRVNQLVTTDGSDITKLLQHKDEFLQTIHAPPDTEVSAITAKCKDRTLYGLAMVMHGNGRTVISETINLPLLPKAVQVLVSGPISQRAALEEVLNKTIGDMNGRAYAMNVTQDPVSPMQHLLTAAAWFFGILAFIRLGAPGRKSKPPPFNPPPPPPPAPAQ